MRRPKAECDVTVVLCLWLLLLRLSVGPRWLHGVTAALPDCFLGSKTVATLTETAFRVPKHGAFFGSWCSRLRICTKTNEDKCTLVVVVEGPDSAVPRAFI